MVSPVPLTSVRASLLNQTVVGKYFSDLGKIINDLGLGDKPKQIWNIDETSSCLTHKPTKVLTKTGTRNLPSRVGNSRESISVLLCINADGESIPPLCIVRGKTHKSLNAYNLREGIDGAKYTFQHVLMA